MRMEERLLVHDGVPERSIIKNEIANIVKRYFPPTFTLQLTEAVEHDLSACPLYNKAQMHSACLLFRYGWLPPTGEAQRTVTRWCALWNKRDVTFNSIWEFIWIRLIGNLLLAQFEPDSSETEQIKKPSGLRGERITVDLPFVFSRVERISKKSSDSLFFSRDEEAFFVSIDKKGLSYLGMLISGIILHQPEEAKKYFDTFCIWCLVKASKTKKILSILTNIGKVLAKYSKCLSPEHRKFYFETLFRHDYVQMILMNTYKSPFTLSHVYHVCPDTVLNVYCNNILPYVYDQSVSQLIPHPPESRWITAMDTISSMLPVLISHGTPRDWARLCIPQVLFAALENVGAPSVLMHNASVLFLDRVSNVIPFGRAGWIKVKQYLLSRGETEITPENILGPEELWCQIVFQTVIRKYLSTKANTNDSDSGMMDYQFLPFIYRFFSLLALNETIDSDIVDSCTNIILSEFMNIDANNISNCAPILSACVTVFPDMLQPILNQLFDKLLPDESQPREFNELTEHEIAKLLDILSALVLFSGSMQRVRHQTPPLLPFYNKLVAVVHIGVRSPFKKVAAASRPLVFRLLMGLTSVYPTEFCTSVLPDRYTQKGERILHTDEEFFAEFSRNDLHPFGKCTCNNGRDLRQLFVQSNGFKYWHHPSQEELNFAQVIAEDVIRFSIVTIENFIKETTCKEAAKETTQAESEDMAVESNTTQSSIPREVQSNVVHHAGLFDFGQETWTVSGTTAAKSSLMSNRLRVVHALNLCRKVASGLGAVTGIPFRSPNAYLDAHLTPLTIGSSSTTERKRSIFEKDAPLLRLSHEFSHAMSLTFIKVAHQIMKLDSFGDDNDFPLIISEAVSLCSETVFSGIAITPIRAQLKRSGTRFSDFAGEFERSHYIVYALNIYEKKCLLRYSPVVNFDPLDCFQVDAKRYALSTEYSYIPRFTSPCQLEKYTRGPSTLLVDAENALGRLLISQYDCVAKSAEDGLSVLGLINGIGIKAACSALDYAIADTERPRTQHSFEIVGTACEFFSLAFMTSIHDIESYYHVIKRLLILAGDGMQEVEECLNDVLLTLDFSLVRKLTARQYNFYVKLLDFTVRSPQFCDKILSVDKKLCPVEPFDLNKDLSDPMGPITRTCLVETVRTKLLYLLLSGFPMVKESQLVMDSSIVSYLPEKLDNTYVDHLSSNLLSPFIDVVTASIYTLFYSLYFDTVDFSVHKFIGKLDVNKVVTNLLELLETHDENNGDPIGNASEFDFVVADLTEFPLFYKSHNFFEVPFISMTAVMLLDDYMKEEITISSVTAAQFPSALCTEFHDCGALKDLDFNKAISNRKMAFAIKQLQVLLTHAVHMEFLLYHDKRVFSYIDHLLDEMMEMISRCSFSRIAYFSSIVQNVIYEEQCAARPFMKCPEVTDSEQLYFKKAVFTRLSNEASERAQIEIASFTISTTPNAPSANMAVEVESGKECGDDINANDTNDISSRVSSNNPACGMTDNERKQLQKETELGEMDVEEKDSHSDITPIADCGELLNYDHRSDISMICDANDGDGIDSSLLDNQVWQQNCGGGQSPSEKAPKQFCLESIEGSRIKGSSVRDSSQRLNVHLAKQKTSFAELKSKSKQAILQKLECARSNNEEEDLQDLKDVSIQSGQMMNLMYLLNIYFMTTLDWNDAISLLETVDLLGLLRHPQTRFVKTVSLLGYAAVFTFEKAQHNERIDAAVSRLNAELISELTAGFDFEQEESRVIGLLSFISSLSLCWSKLVFNVIYHDLVKMLVCCLVGKQKISDEAKSVFKEIRSMIPVQDFCGVNKDFIINELAAAVKEASDPRVISILLFNIQKLVRLFLFEITPEQLASIHSISFQYLVDKSQDVVNEAANINGLYYRCVLEKRAQMRAADFDRYSQMLCDKSSAVRNGALYGTVALLYTLELIDESDIKELTKYVRRLGHLENDVPDIVCSASTLIVQFWSTHKSSWIQFSKWLSNDIIRTLRGSLAPPSYIT